MVEDAACSPYPSASSRQAAPPDTPPRVGRRFPILADLAALAAIWLFLGALALWLDAIGAAILAGRTGA